MIETLTQIIEQICLVSEMDLGLGARDRATVKGHLKMVVD